MGEYRLLLKHVDVPNYHDIQVYEQYGGYQALRKALSMERQAIIDEVKKSGLRGRGGAGFPAWIKWNGIPKDDDKPHYVLCNSDEGEPGTFKDFELMFKTPHQLVEGMIYRWLCGAGAARLYLHSRRVCGVRAARASGD
jgi:NADH-quinone oxidoreductase subunit F